MTVTITFKEIATSNSHWESNGSRCCMGRPLLNQNWCMVTDNHIVGWFPGPHKSSGSRHCVQFSSCTVKEVAGKRSCPVWQDATDTGKSWRQLRLQAGLAELKSAMATEKPAFGLLGMWREWAAGRRLRRGLPLHLWHSGLSVTVETCDIRTIIVIQSTEYCALKLGWVCIMPPGAGLDRVKRKWWSK